MSGNLVMLSLTVFIGGVHTVVEVGSSTTGNEGVMISLGLFTGLRDWRVALVLRASVVAVLLLLRLARVAGFDSCSSCTLK